MRPEQIRKRLPDLQTAEMAFCAAMVLLVAAIGPPGYMARRHNRMQRCQDNLTRIDTAKEQWAMENGQVPGVVVEEWHIVSEKNGYLATMPVCLSDSSYVLEPVGSDPECASTLPGHSLSESGAGFSNESLTDLWWRFRNFW